MPTPDDVRARIRSEHAVLRRLMLDCAMNAGRCLREERMTNRVRDALLGLRAELERHALYEEQVLVPILRDADAWGSVRVEKLMEEHKIQRATIAQLIEDATTRRRSPKELADEIGSFICLLERDVEEEDRERLTDEALGEVWVRTDQIDG